MNKPLSILIKTFLLLCLLAAAGQAQLNLTSEVISVRDGLSSNNIRGILQDKYGYIWIATSDGVNIYDGYKIRVFKNIPDDSTSLPSNNIYRILEDHEGTIWITTGEGLASYNRNSGTFKTFKPYESATELANRIVFIYEDSRNNLWVSTQNGTLQFDRNSEKYVRYDVMLKDNSVLRFVNFSGPLMESSSGELYNVTSGFGLLKYDYEARLFVEVPLKDNFNEKILDNTCFVIIPDADNNLWLGSSRNTVGPTGGLLKIDLDALTGAELTPFIKRDVGDRFRDNAVSGLFVDRNENLWVGTGINGIYLMDMKSGKFEHTVPPSSTYFYTGFVKDNSGILWFGTSRGVIKYDFDRKPFETFSFSEDNSENANKSVLSFAESPGNKNRIWLGTPLGVRMFDSQNHSFNQQTSSLKNLSRFSKMAINNILEQDDGTLWLATSINGLYALNLNTGAVKNFKRKFYVRSTLYNDNINSLALDKNENVWIGTDEGLNVLNKDKDTIKPLPSFQNRMYLDELQKQLKKMRETTNPVSSIIKVGDYADLSKEFVLRKDSQIMIYSIGEGLRGENMFDFGWLESETGDTVWSAGEFGESFHAGGSLKNRLKIGLLELKAGRYKLRYKSDDSHSVESYNATPPQDSIFWGTQLFSMADADFKNLRELLVESEANDYLEGEEIRVLFNDSKNNMWVGTADGVSVIDPGFHIQNFNIQNNSTSAGTKRGVSDNVIRDINEDNAGNIWIATSDGLNRFDPSSATFSVIREKDGLPSSNLSAIEVDDEGHLWVSGLKGLSKVELDSTGNLQIIVNYDVKDGLQGYEFLHNSSYKDREGRLYFAGFDGFNAFYPGSSNRTPPYLSVQDIKISNKSITHMEAFQDTDLNMLPEMSLSHDQNDLSFEFASIHFSRPDKNRLMYKMEGVDEDWITSDRRFAAYTNLTPGDYTFNLRGSNGDGIWHPETKKIHIHISAPWYNNAFAYVVYAILFFGLLYGIRKSEMARQQKNAKLKESQLRAETAEMEARAIRAENERKTKELEEARDLQLSMLPKDLPRLPHLDIAVYMQTATEVGGDYYDFHVALDGTLTVVIGDATGHGMRAGTMVITAKSLFNSYAPNPDILFSFSEITRCIKQMNFGKLSMCMTMLKIKGNKMQMSTAGMPPSFIFRRDTRVVEEHLFKAMPLGTMEKFPYEIKDTTLSPGDTILLMSDGLPELKDNKGDMYSYMKVRNGFEQVADQSAEDIIRYLKDEGASWINNEDPDDDVTFVVLKVK